MTISAAGHAAFDAQREDDERCRQHVAAIFIEDAMAAFDVPSRHFERVEEIADQLWKRFRCRRAIRMWRQKKRAA